MARTARSELAAVLLWAVSASSVAVQPLLERSPLASRLPDTTAAAHADSAHVPNDPQYAIATRVDGIGRIIAAVTINGRGPFRFMLDTGASRTALAASMPARLGLDAQPQAPILVVGISGTAVVASVHIDSLESGDMHFHDLDVPVLTGPVLEGIDGILGMDGFAGMKVSADFTKDRFTINASRGRRAPFGYSVIPIEIISEHLLMAHGSVGAVHVQAIIDTGTSRTLGNPALLAALKHGHSGGAKESESAVIDATQASQLAAVTRVPEVRLGAASIDDLAVTFGDFNVFKAWGLEEQPALLVGMDVLGTLDELTIDYRRDELQLLPRDPWSRVIVATER
jgi:clan AA aspartic protease (TIGR02281 family)